MEPKPRLISYTDRRSPSNHKIGLFECFCGNQFEYIATVVINGRKKSCGCITLQRNREQATRHGLSNTREYRIWRGMKKRCLLPTNEAYFKYGGRGIKVCDRWLESFENFLEDMELAPTRKHTLDRIDNNGNYEPSNCRWATMLVQERNRGNTLFVLVNGEKMRLTEYAETTNLTYTAVYMRLCRGKLEGVERL